MRPSQSLWILYSHCLPGVQEAAAAQFDVAMEIKNNGIELEVRDTPANNERHLGDLVVTKTKLIWCPGRTDPANGHKISWANFIQYARTLPTD